MFTIQSMPLAPGSPSERSEGLQAVTDLELAAIWRAELRKRTRGKPSEYERQILREFNRRVWATAEERYLEGELVMDLPPAFRQLPADDVPLAC